MKEATKRKLATLIKELRADQSQRTFAKSLGVSFASIQSWENGDAMLCHQWTICLQLQVKPDIHCKD
jgi:DNA-binding transcriptional regulator YiaG